jgi:hypothetical protein
VTAGLADPRAIEAELSATLARASSALGSGPVRLDPMDEPATEVVATIGGLADPRSPALDGLLDAARTLTGTTDRRLLATWVQGWLAWWVVGPAVAAWWLDSRVPPLDPAAVTVAWDGRSATVTLGRGAWAVLPGDPLATSSGSTAPPVVVADAPSMADELHDRVVGLLAPMIDAFRDRARVGVRQQWLQSADRIASALLLLGRASDDPSGGEARAEGAVQDLLAVPGSPLGNGRARLEVVSAADLVRTVQRRATCCLAFRGIGGSLCATCPVRGDEAVEADVRAWLAAGAPAGRF